MNTSSVFSHSNVIFLKNCTFKILENGSKCENFRSFSKKMSRFAQKIKEIDQRKCKIVKISTCRGLQKASKNLHFLNSNQKFHIHEKPIKTLIQTYHEPSPRYSGPISQSIQNFLRKFWSRSTTNTNPRLKTLSPSKNQNNFFDFALPVRNTIFR